MDSRPEAPASVEFGRFRLVPRRRELLVEGRPVKIGGRAFDLLVALVEAGGRVVDKDTLLRSVWPNSIVEENSLQAQIAALRQALGSERELIRTVVGRGYQFIGEIRPPAGALGDMTTASGAVTNLPEQVSQLIGREAAIAELMNLVAAHRLVTLTGAGGIGKTRLAIEAARQALSLFPQGVWLIELSPLVDPKLVPAAVAAAVGLELPAGEVSTERVAGALRASHVLLLLDTCEHVIGAAAAMAEALLRTSPAARVIATSRERLRVDGEWTYLVPPLPAPPISAADAKDIGQYAAVQLFIARAQAANGSFAAEPDLAAIAAICRRVEGIPLAIELAAATAAELGVDQLAARLNERFRLLARGSRTALQRHQTLRATLDWSYGLLNETERLILQRLGVFPGSFRLEAASAITGGPEVAPQVVSDIVANLVARSLVSVDVGGAVAHYRLLDMTRAYALEKLTEAGEERAVVRRHAVYFRDLFERAENEWETRPTAAWLTDYGGQLDDIRTALDWAFSPDGEPALGIALAAAAIPLWTHLSLLDESRWWAERALAAIGQRSAGNGHHSLRLHCALAAALMWARGSAPEVLAAWKTALEIAVALGDGEYQLRALWGLWLCHQILGKYRAALDFAERFHALARTSGDLADQLIGDRLIGGALHALGEHAKARCHIERMLARYVSPPSRSHIDRFQRDQRAGGHSVLARILWVQGFPDQAMRAAETAIEEVLSSHHTASLCVTLAESACPIALETGDLSSAVRFVEMLLEYAARHALTYWLAWGRSFEGALALKRGDPMTGIRLLQSGIDELGEALITMPFVSFQAHLAEALGRAGSVAEGLVAIEVVLEQLVRTEEGSKIAELLRIKGELLLLKGSPAGTAAAEQHFRQAIDWARRQGALSWELRASTSLARLLADQGYSADAIAVLQPVYDRLTEGFATADLKTAKVLLDVLR